MKDIGSQRERETLNQVAQDDVGVFNSNLSFRKVPRSPITKPT